MTDHTQLTRDDIAAMSVNEINTAHSQGRLNEVMGIPTDATPPERPTRDDLKTMTDEQISHALTEGRLDHFFRPMPAADAEHIDAEEITENTDDTTEENNE